MRVCKDCEPMPAHYIEDFDFLKLGFWGGGGHRHDGVSVPWVGF